MIENDDSSAEIARLALSRPSLLQQSAFIGGSWVADRDSLPVTNPATGRLLGTVPALDASFARRAVDAAHCALPKWRGLAAQQRATILRRWYELIVANTTDLARLLTAEQGKPLAEARAEVAHAAAFIEWFAEEAKRLYGDTIPGHQGNKRLTVIKQPVGVVAAVTPWNFPAAMITRKVGPALAAGCTVVLKPSELAPFSALALACLAEEAGVPAGVFNVVTGPPKPIGEVLTEDPRVRKFTFTGSTPVGKLLAARCMSSVKRVSLELGGNAPFIVFEDADLDAAVEGALVSKFRNTGQTCVCANRLLIHAAVHDEFVKRLTGRVQSFVVGDGLERETHQGPLINAAAVSKSVAHVHNAVEFGAQVVTGGSPLPGPGHFFRPTVLTGVTPEMKVFQEETFGPVAGIVRFRNTAEAVKLANTTTAGLAAYVFTRDIDRAALVSEALEYGMVGLNTGLISTEVAPFGGMKESGLGREGSHYGMDDYVDIKLICSEVAGSL